MHANSCVYDLSPSLNLPFLTLAFGLTSFAAQSQSASADNDTITTPLFYPASLMQSRLKVLSGWLAVTSGYMPFYIIFAL